MDLGEKAYTYKFSSREMQIHIGKDQNSLLALRLSFS